MKKILFLLIVVSLLVFEQACYGISIASGERTYECGFDNSAGNEHVHVSTKPALVFSLTVTAVAGGGFAQLIETKDAGVDTSPSESVGQGYVSEGTVKADVVVATANNTIQVTFEDGLAIGDQLFLDCHEVRAIVSYKE